MKSKNNSLTLLMLAMFVLAMTMVTSNPIIAASVVLSTNGAGTTGNPTTLDVSGAASNYLAAQTNDGDTSYVYTTNSGFKTDYYSMDNVSLTGDIEWVRIYILVRASNGTSNQDYAKTVLRIDGATYPVTVNTGTETSYTQYYTEYPYYPGTTNPWTWSNINNIEAGVALRDATSGSTVNEARCTRVWVVVEYTVGGSISGAKFYDADTDGVWGEYEPAIEGIEICLYDDEGTLIDTQYTDENGEYFFDELDAGDYTIMEVLPEGWINTTPDSISIEGLSGASEENDFGNVCIGCDGGALGLGWWTNNGEDDGTDDLSTLCSLNLRNENGDDFDPTVYGNKVQGKFPAGSFADWLVNAYAENMAYMLSAQLATMELNVLNGFVDSESRVYAPGTDSANAAGFASIGDLMSEADAELYVDGTAMAGDEWRNYQEALKDALDAANNNLSFVCPGPCLPIVYP